MYLDFAGVKNSSNESAVMKIKGLNQIMPNK